MNITNTFILCHDEDIIIDLLQAQKYKTVDPYKFIFLGFKSTEKIKDNKDIIIARDLPENIELNKNCLQYCGWYSIFKNKLYNANYIRLIDYDIDIKKWNNETNFGVKGHINYDFNFYFDDGFGDFITFQNNILKKTGRYPKDLAKIFSEKHNITKWFSAADVLVKANIFESFMMWMEDLFISEKDNYYFGMHFERYLVNFCLSNNILYECVDDETDHKQLMSHSYY